MSDPVSAARVKDALGRWHKLAEEQDPNLFPQMACGAKLVRRDTGIQYRAFALLEVAATEDVWCERCVDIIFPGGSR